MGQILVPMSQRFLSKAEEYESRRRLKKEIAQTTLSDPECKLLDIQDRSFVQDGCRTKDLKGMGSVERLGFEYHPL